MGLAPLLFLAEGFGEGNTDILMGGRSAEELFWTKLYESLSKNIYLTTDDGSVGTKGTVMALLPQLLKEGGYDCVYVCGPVPMMRAVANACLEAGVKCQVSLENTWPAVWVRACPVPAKASASASRSARTARYSGQRR